ncbi:MAG: hypothetical protein WC508_05305 [Patescibacteria group bacterium]
MKVYLCLITIIIQIWFLPAIFLIQNAQAATSDIAATRQQLEQQLKDIENQIAQYQKQLTSIKGQKNTLTNKIKQLKTQQAALQLQVKETSLKLDSLEEQMMQTQAAITTIANQNQMLQIQLSDVIRQIYFFDQKSLLYNVIMSNSLADIFNEIQNYQQLISNLHSIFVQVKETNNQLQEQSQSLNDQWEESQNLLSIKVLQQKQLAGSVGEQNALLSQTKGKESSYQNMLKSSQKQATEIKNRIYQLFNVGKQITFGQAVEIAQWVSGQTSVPTAFLLAILTQESNLGQNVGTCNRAGDPAEKSWKVIMKPERDQQPFLTITKELGLDPDTTPVSCPMRDKSGKQIGWGGAMGPAQFIPSTWMGYKNKVSALTGKSPASPWDIRDAFLAAAILLKANGASSARQSQWNAAMRYFSGSTNPAYSFYGDNVLVLADKYQDDIDKLNNQ